MEQSIKNESESKLVLELFEDCEKGLYTKIKKNLEDNAFSSKTVDIAIRKCMRNRKRENRNMWEKMRNEVHIERQVGGQRETKGKKKGKEIQK